MSGKKKSSHVTLFFIFSSDQVEWVKNNLYLFLKCPPLLNFFYFSLGHQLAKKFCFYFPFVHNDRKTLVGNCDLWNIVRAAHHHTYF